MPGTESNSYGYQYGQLFTTVYDFSNGQQTETLNGNLSRARGTWYRQSGLTPGFKRQYKGMKGSKRAKARKIDLPMNGFLFRSTKKSYASGSVTFSNYAKDKSGGWIETTTGLFDVSGLTSAPDSALLSVLDAKARSKLLSGIKDQTVNLAQAAGEFRQTKDLFLGTAKRIAAAARAFKTGDMWGAATALGASPRGPKRRKHLDSQDLANNWLELQYGWKPLLSDIYGSAEFLANQTYRKPRTRISSYAERVVPYSEETLGYIDRTFDKGSALHAVKYVVWFQEPAGGTPATALGLTNPAAVAWELLPWSFVVDWFIPIGTFLNNIDATIGAEFVKGCKTTFWRWSSTRTEFGRDLSSENSIVKLGKHLIGSCEQVECSRTALGSFPSNPLPRFKSPLSGEHVANAMALLATAFNRRG